jgi:DnaJ-class molecular chaperone
MFGGDVPYLEVPLVVTLGELFHGCSKRVTFPKHTQCDACESRGVNDAAFKPKTCKSCGGEGPSAADCDKCNGRGRVVPQDKRCPVCDGFGTLEEEGHITVRSGCHRCGGPMGALGSLPRCHA